MSKVVSGRQVVHLAIRTYQLSLSGLIGRQCRYLPTCSNYADEAIARHGVWAGSWMGVARLCRCHPLGSSGYDPVPPVLDSEAAWYRPWRFGRWTMREPSTGVTTAPVTSREGPRP